MSQSPTPTAQSNPASVIPPLLTQESPFHALQGGDVVLVGRERRVLPSPNDALLDAQALSAWIIVCEVAGAELRTTVDWFRSPAISGFVGGLVAALVAVFATVPGSRDVTAITTAAWIGVATVVAAAVVVLVVLLVTWRDAAKLKRINWLKMAYRQRLDLGGPQVPGSPAALSPAGAAS